MGHASNPKKIGRLYVFSLGWPKKHEPKENSSSFNWQSCVNRVVYKGKSMQQLPRPTKKMPQKE